MLAIGQAGKQWHICGGGTQPQGSRDLRSPQGMSGRGLHFQCKPGEPKRDQQQGQLSLGRPRGTGRTPTWECPEGGKASSRP